MSDADGFPPQLFPLEQEVMDAAWDRGGEFLVRDVLDDLNAGAGKERAYTTVLTIVTRLHTKGLLRRRREGKTHVYEPVLDREGFRAALARREIGALVDQFGDVALVQFARHVEALEPEHRRTLQRLARGADQTAD